MFPGLDWAQPLIAAASLLGVRCLGEAEDWAGQAQRGQTSWSRQDRCAAALRRPPGDLCPRGQGWARPRCPHLAEEGHDMTLDGSMAPPGRCLPGSLHCRTLPGPPECVNLPPSGSRAVLDVAPVIGRASAAAPGPGARVVTAAPGWSLVNRILPFWPRGRGVASSTHTGHPTDSERVCVRQSWGLLPRASGRSLGGPCPSQPPCEGPGHSLWRRALPAQHPHSPLFLGSSAGSQAGCGPQPGLVLLEKQPPPAQQVKGQQLRPSLWSPKTENRSQVPHLEAYMELVGVLGLGPGPCPQLDSPPAAPAGPSQIDLEEPSGSAGPPQPTGMRAMWVS